MILATKKECKKLLTLLLALLSLSTAVFSADNTNANLSQTKNKLALLDTQIHSLKKNLSIANDKHGLLTRELAKNEKDISLNIFKLRQTQEELGSKQRQINQARLDAAALQKKLESAQKLLQEQIRIRFQMGEPPSFLQLLRHEKASAMNHWLVLQHYFLESYKENIKAIAATQSALAKTKEALVLQLSQQKVLYLETHRSQQELEQNKKYHQTLIHTLTEEIQSKESRLDEFERNKRSLSALLKSLTVQNTSTKTPFRIMQHKLPQPIHQGGIRIEKTAQGLTFFAKEGSQVYAVHPGKIVFSDWLNGYGLLLIIDHGQGFMTLYAHNQSVFKHKGESVLRGEAIAAVGHSGGIHDCGLYFEVRHNGKVVMPLQWLSKSGI